MLSQGYCGAAPPVVCMLLLVATAVAAATAHAFPERPPQHFGAHPSIVASPPSTLLQPGTTTLDVSVITTTATSCRWGSMDAPFAAHNVG